MKPACADPSRNDAPMFFQKRFFSMWTALSFGAFSDNVLRQSLLIGVSAGVISVPDFVNSDNAIPLIGTLLPAAILIFTSISGQFADKYETSLMFRRTKLAEVILMSAAALAFVFGNGGFAIAALFAMGAQSAFFSPVRTGAMPKYLQANELVRGNALCNGGLFTFILLGYGVGGFLIVQENGLIAVAAVLVAAAIVGYIGAANTPQVGANEPSLKLSVNGFTQIAKIFKIAFAARGVVPPLVGIGAFYFLSTAATVAAPLFGRDSLHAEPLVWTALNALFAIGAGVGALIAAGLSKNRTGLGFSAMAIFLGGLLSIGAYFATPFISAAPETPMRVTELASTPGGLLLCFFFIAIAACAGVYIAPLQAAMQRRAPRETRARIMSASAFANAAFAALGSLMLLGVTQTGANPSIVFFCIGAVMISVAGVMIVRRHTLPEGLYDEELSLSD